MHLVYTADSFISTPLHLPQVEIMPPVYTAGCKTHTTNRGIKNYSFLSNYATLRNNDNAAAHSNNNIGYWSDAAISGKHYYGDAGSNNNVACWNNATA